MVGNDNVDAFCIRVRDLLDLGRAEVNGDNELDALLSQLLNSPYIQPIALGVAMRNIVAHLQTYSTQELREHDAARNPVAVVVAPHAHRLVIFYRREDPLDRLIHVGQ